MTSEYLCSHTGLQTWKIGTIGRYMYLNDSDSTEVTLMYFITSSGACNKIYTCEAPHTFHVL